MDYKLTFGQAILSMFQLGMLVCLWGIYTEVRKLVGAASKEN